MLRPFAINVTVWRGPKNSKKTREQKLNSMNCSGSTGLLMWAKSRKGAVKAYLEAFKGKDIDIVACNATSITMDNAWHLMDEGLNPWHIERMGEHPHRTAIQRRMKELLKIRDEMKTLFMKVQ